MSILTGEGLSLGPGQDDHQAKRMLKLIRAPEMVIERLVIQEMVRNVGTQKP
jgi:hypothetical protein